MRRQVIDELRWDPAVDARRITVEISDGIVLLRGAVRTYVEKCRAEEIVKQIRGVAGVRNELEVRLTIGDYRRDATLERLVRDVLDSRKTGRTRPFPRVASRSSAACRGHFKNDSPKKRSATSPACAASRTTFASCRMRNLPRIWMPC